ncbi:MAG: ribosomal protein S5 [Patescibacteria group bacterium]
MTQQTAQKNNISNSDKVSRAPVSKNVSKETSQPHKESVSKERKNQNRRDTRKPRQEFEQKIISIRRVTRVVAGGRRFSFSVSLVIGDKKGSVGVGIGKATDTALAIEKAYNEAKRSMIKVPLDKNMMIPHSVTTKFTSSEVFIKPAPGKGIIAGSSVRTVLELAGVTDVNAKVFSRSKNAFNNAKAAIQALSSIHHPDSEKLKK